MTSLLHTYSTISADAVIVEHIWGEIQTGAERNIVLTDSLEKERDSQGRNDTFMKVHYIYVFHPDCTGRHSEDRNYTFNKLHCIYVFHHDCTEQHHCVNSPN